MTIFATLLWIDERNNSSINNKNKSIVSYFRQVRLLARSLHNVFDQRLLLLTNQKDLCEDFFKGSLWKPNILNIESKINIPDGVRFYAAHHKFSALHALQKLLKNENDRFYLIDADVIVNRGFSADQSFAIANSDLITYDISDQVFSAYGAAKIKSDIEAISTAKLVEHQWFGGEFLSGNLMGLNALISQIEDFLPNYINNIDNIHHVGDEMFVTSALNILKKNNNIRILAGNPYYFCSRHWSRSIDQSLSWNFKHSFVHCPGSKPALELLSLSNPSRWKSISVLKFYQVAVLGYQLVKRLMNLNIYKKLNRI